MACRMSAGTVVWPLAVIVDSVTICPLDIDNCKELKVPAFQLVVRFMPGAPACSYLFWTCRLKFIQNRLHSLSCCLA